MDFYPSDNAAFWAGVEEYATGPADYRFAGPGAGSREIRVLVVPDEGESWVGGYASADPGYKSLSALIGTDSPTGLLVIERGTGFLGDVLQPERFEILPVREPITSWFRVPSSGIVLLGTPWSVLAVESTGVRWVSERLSIDGLVIIGADDNQVWGVADPTDDAERSFTLDIATGALVEDKPDLS